MKKIIKNIWEWLCEPIDGPRPVFPHTAKAFSIPQQTKTSSEALTEIITTLSFYADASNYALTRDERGMETTPIFIDAGKRARKVLEESQ